LQKVEAQLAPAGQIYILTWYQSCESEADMRKRVRATPGYDPEAHHWIFTYLGFVPNECPKLGTKHSHRHDPVECYPYRPLPWKRSP
jgi:hypothetical protein